MQSSIYKISVNELQKKPRSIIKIKEIKNTIAPDQSRYEMSEKDNQEITTTTTLDDENPHIELPKYREIRIKGGVMISVSMKE